MKTTRLLKKNKHLIWIILLDILLIFSVFSIVEYVSRLIQKDISITLDEVASQNKDIITNNINSEMSAINLAASQIAERLAQSDGLKIDEVYMSYVKDTGNQRLYVADTEGIATFYDDKKVNIHGRLYYINAISGNQNISERIISRHDGKDVFVISVPIVWRENIIGTLHQQYTLEEMNDIVQVSLYADKGETYIINESGYILFNSRSAGYSRESDNFYRLVYMDNSDEAKSIENNIANNVSGSLTLTINKVPVYAVYTPVESVFDWYLISIVETGIILPNAQLVIKTMAFILFIAMIAFMLSIIYYVLLKLRQQKKLENMLFVDPVTKGNTQQKFVIDMMNITNSNKEKQYYLVSLDIDNFKYINQLHGYEEGDNVLREINKMIASKLQSDEAVARMYSDHFVILLSSISESRIEQLFPKEVNINDIKIYTSVGIYNINQLDENLSLMIDKAQIAASSVKGIRHNNVRIYTDELDQKMIRDEEIKRDIGIAIKNGEILPFFQPKINIDNNKVVGAEALARWIKPNGDIVSPDHFIPVCESTGLIVDIDMIIFEKTLQFIKKAMDSGYKVHPVSVNFSRNHLLINDFSGRLVTLLDKYQVPAELIEIEITETVIFDNYQLIDEFIDDLHQHNFNVSMDDFGSGASSLHLLKDINIDIIKIDRGFLKDTSKDGRQKVIFEAIVNMAKKLNMRIVVEGVETQANVDLMREAGCLVAQGYYYSKPLNEKDYFDKYYDNKE